MSNVNDSVNNIGGLEKINTLWKQYNNLINTKPSGYASNEEIPFKNYIVNNSIFNQDIPENIQINNDICLNIILPNNQIIEFIITPNDFSNNNNYLNIELLDNLFDQSDNILVGSKCNFENLGYKHIEFYYKKECYPTIYGSTQQIYTWFIPDPSNGNISNNQTNNLLQNTIASLYDPYYNTYKYKLFYKLNSQFYTINFASNPDFAYLDNKSGFLYFYGGQRTNNNVTLQNIRSQNDTNPSPPYLSYIKYNGNIGFDNLKMNGSINIDGSLNINNDLSFIDISNNLYNVLNTHQIKEYINSLNISGGSGGSGGSGLTLNQILKSNNDASFTNLDISGVLKGTSGTYSNNQLALGSHIIPTSNASYDLGNAEYKIRHLFLSDKSIWIGDKHKIDISNSNIYLKKRNNNVPQALINSPGYSESDLLTSAKNRDPSINNINDLLLEDYINYALTLDPPLDIQSIYDQNPNNWENNIDLIDKLNNTNDNSLNLSNKNIFDISNLTTKTASKQDLSSLFFNTITPSKNSSNILININADLYCSYALEERISVELWRDLSMLTQSNNLGSTIATGGLTIPYNLTYLDSLNNNSLTKYYLKYQLENNNSSQEMGIINIQNNSNYGSSNIILREI